MTISTRAGLDAGQRRLLLFLSVATFFDGYDLVALTQLLPNIRADFGLDELQGGALVSFVNLGTVAAYFLVRGADRIGRRRLLLVTIGGYTLFTFASGLAPGALLFAVAQLLARVFLAAETATAMVYAAEELPARKRGFGLGVVQGSFALGMVCGAVAVPLLLRTAPGWRSVYLVAAAPLVLLAFARWGLSESRRFVAAGPRPGRGSRLALLRGPYRRRVLQLGVVWSCTYAGTQCAVAFWKEFALAERGLTDAQVGVAVGLSAILAMPAVFSVGALLDRLGRRAGGALVFGVEVAALVATYSLHGFWPLTAALVFGVFGAGAVQVVLNAYTTELFPTPLRGDAFAWANNAFGRIGFVLVPLLVGHLAGSIGWGAAVRLTAAGPLIALVLILAWFPETKARELEETSAL